MGRKLTIPYYRPTFVQKDLSEVGDGTAYPMEVTVDQLAEIFYRVKKCAWAQGEVMWNSDAYGLVARGTSLPAAPDHAEVVSPNVAFRGYVFAYQLPQNGLDSDADPYFENPVGPVSSEGVDYYYRLHKADELGFWFDTEGNLESMTWGTFYFSSTHFKTGLSLESNYRVTGEDGSSSDVNFVATLNDGLYYPCDSYVRFSGKVAFVDDDNNGDPFSIGNKLYPEFEFYALAFGFNGSFQIGTNPELLGPGFVSGSLQFKFRLSNNIEIGCPVYYDLGVPSTIGDFILEATEWWPYAHNNGSPFWNRFDGTKLSPFTPAASNFNNPNNSNLIPAL